MAIEDRFIYQCFEPESRSEPGAAKAAIEKTGQQVMQILQEVAVQDHESGSVHAPGFYVSCLSLVILTFCRNRSNSDSIMGKAAFSR